MGKMSEWLLVTDFRNMNKNIKRPTHPTESGTQLLRHIKASSKYFAALDMSSGYHQIAVDEESSKLLVIATPAGRFKVKIAAQGITSASDMFNLFTDGNTRFGSRILKNMDDLLIFGDSLKEVKEKVEEFLMFAKKEILKLKTSKIIISEEVKLDGSVTSAEMVQGEGRT